MTENYLCIHGHFYQPPRENPWLNAIEYQASARPYHDWNDRITRECYGPNARARIHGQEGLIRKLVNNYEYMSFDFGPTLLSWLENAHPWIYSQILAADHASRIRFKGHGNALAQVYNHIIMPLACRRDKLTQIRWGLADFKKRFGRQAEGMWLAETAVDTETLDLMAREGVKFTALSPTQAQSVRPLADESDKNDWQDVAEGRIDPSQPYRIHLDKTGARFIDVFFYDGPLSKAVAYEKILASGDAFLSRIEHTFGNHQDRPRLVSIATDGESYGHHFKFGDLALAWLFDHLEQTGLIKLANYAQFLEDFPPQNEVRLFENSSWSCAHGVERWRSDCGCNVGHKPGWNQAWRAPLREGLHWLHDQLKEIFEKQGSRLLKDPWKARDEYIMVFINPTDQQRARFLKRHAAYKLEKEEEAAVFQILESQRMSLYMFTSCGWFFDDISGLEAIQVLKYAARAIDLIKPWTKTDLEHELKDLMSKAISNDPAYGDGNQVYQHLVEPSRIDSSFATAHYAVAAVAEVPLEETFIFTEIVRPVQQRILEIQDLHAILGEVRVKEKITGQEFIRIYLAIRQDGRRLNCLVGENSPLLDLDRVVKEIESPLEAQEPEKIEEAFLRHFPQAGRYVFKDLIPDTRMYLTEKLGWTVYRHLLDSFMEHHGSLEHLIFLVEDKKEQIPEILRDVFGLLLSDQLARFMDLDNKEHPIEWADLQDTVEKAKCLALTLNEPMLREKAQCFLREQISRLASKAEKTTIENLISFLDMAKALRLDIDLWECQNMFYDLYQDQKSAQILGPELSSGFNLLGRRLGFLLDGE